MPEATLKAFSDHGEIGQTLSPSVHGWKDVLAKFTKADIDIESLAAQLQDEGAASFDKSWSDLMNCISSKSKALKVTH